MCIRFRDEPKNKAFRELLSIAAEQHFRAGLVVDDVARSSRGEELCAKLGKLGAVERVAAEFAGETFPQDRLIQEFEISSGVIDLLLCYAAGPLDFCGYDMPELFTVFSTDGRIWFWSDGAEVSCGMNLREEEWRKTVARSTVLDRLRTGTRWANLFDAGGAEELVGDLAIPTSLEDGRDIDAFRRDTLLDEIGRGVQTSDADSMLRSLGAAALVLDARRGYLGSIVWQSTGIGPEGLLFSDTQLLAAAKIVREVLASDRWRATWPESETRQAVERDLLHLLAAVP